MRDFKELDIWKLGHLLALEIYELTLHFPTEEKYGLTSQVRRCALSIPTNIAEGCGRGTTKELMNFCRIAMGSASELEYLLLFVKDITVINETQYLVLIEKLILLKKKINAFIKYQKTQIQKNPDCRPGRQSHNYPNT